MRTILLQSPIAPFPDIDAAAGLVEQTGLPLWVWVSIGIATALVSAGVGWWLRGRQRVTERSPREQAVLRMDEIAGRLEGMSAREAAFAISNVLREYLTSEYRLHATTQTTPEFLAEISARSALPAEMGPTLADFLRRADYTKFAAHSEEPELKQRLHAEASDLIRRDRAE